jgi:hypothetical protein
MTSPQAPVQLEVLAFGAWLRADSLDRQLAGSRWPTTLRQVARTRVVRTDTWAARG